MPTGSRQPLQYAVAAFTGKGAQTGHGRSLLRLRGRRRPGSGEGRCVPLDAEAAHDIERMLAAAQRDAGLIYICNPNNPTGTLTPARADRQSDRNAKPERSVVLVDEAYIHFPTHPASLAWPSSQDVLVLRTFSKLYGMAGARLAWPSGIRSCWRGWRPSAATTWCPRRPPTPGWKACVTTIWCHGASSRTQRSASAPSPGCASRASAAPPAANCFMVDMRRPAELVIAELEKQGCVGRPWASWPNWVRVTVGSEEEMQAFRSAFASVSRRHQVAMR